MTHDKAFIEGLFSPAERTGFNNAAKSRTPAMRWDNLFPDGKDEIVLPLLQEGETLSSIDDDIERALARHNEDARKAVEAAKAEGVTPGSKMRYWQLQRDPENPAMLIVTHNGKEQKDRYSLGKFLREKNEWLLQDEWEIEHGRKKTSPQENATQEPATLEKVANKNSLAADQFTPDSLRVVISRDPMQIAAMSTGRRWTSCMAKGSINYHYVPHDIRQGSLVAYLVAKDDVHARYPLMRQLLKPFRNTHGDTILVPSYVYGDETQGNSASCAALDHTLRQFVQSKVNTSKSGIFNMDSALYTDGQATRIALGNKDWSISDIRDGLSKFIKGAVVEHLTEIERDNEVDKHTRALCNLLGEPATLARIYYHKLVDESLGGNLPSPDMVLEAAQYVDRLGIDHQNIGIAGAKALATALESSRLLTSLFLMSCTLGDQSGLILVNALKKNRNRTWLDVISSGLSDSGTKEMVNVIINSGNKNLYKCCLGLGVDSLDRYCNNNWRIAAELAKKITTNPEALTASDKKEIVERKPAIREHANYYRHCNEELYERKQYKAVTEYFARMKQAKNKPESWRERTASGHHTLEEPEGSIHSTARYRQPRPSRSGSGSLSPSY